MLATAIFKKVSVCCVCAVLYVCTVILFMCVVVCACDLRLYKCAV